MLFINAAFFCDFSCIIFIGKLLIKQAQFCVHFPPLGNMGTMMLQIDFYSGKTL
jgi:hypothetical protein